jgi:hypothetical protein
LPTAAASKLSDITTHNNSLAEHDNHPTIIATSLPINTIPESTPFSTKSKEKKTDSPSYYKVLQESKEPGKKSPNNVNDYSVISTLMNNRRDQSADIKREISLKRLIKDGSSLDESRNIKASKPQ